MDVIADLALVFKWTPRDIDKMTVDELLEYHKRAIERVKFLTVGV